jgi:hypothetical protein
MKVIREEEGEIQIHTTVLAIEWGLPRCCQVGCDGIPTAIIVNAGPDEDVTFALCEACYQLGVNGPHHYSLENVIIRRKDET